MNPLFLENICWSPSSRPRLLIGGPSDNDANVGDVNGDDNDGDDDDGGNLT